MANQRKVKKFIYINSSYCLCNTQYTVCSCLYRDCYIPSVFTFRRVAHSAGLPIPLIPTLFFPFFCLSSLHPFSFVNVLLCFIYVCIMTPLWYWDVHELILTHDLHWSTGSKPGQPLKIQGHLICIYTYVLQPKWLN